MQEKNTLQVLSVRNLLFPKTEKHDIIVNKMIHTLQLQK